MTIIRACQPCKPHAFQDATHRGKRVMNQTVTAVGAPKQFRCTICDKTHTE